MALRPVASLKLNALQGMRLRGSSSPFVPSLDNLRPLPYRLETAYSHGFEGVAVFRARQMDPNASKSSSVGL